jgi:multidrug efflux pump subunit AcrA (membrane-fusion protein)
MKRIMKSASIKKFSLVLVFLILCSCVPTSQNTITPVSPTQIPEPEFEFNQEIRIRGKVIILDQLNLSFPMSGVVLELLVEKGDNVQQGDVIARLDTSSLLDDIARAEGELAIAKAILERDSAGPHDPEIEVAVIEVTAIASQPTLNSAQATAQVLVNLSFAILM